MYRAHLAYGEKPCRRQGPSHQAASTYIKYMDGLLLRNPSGNSAGMPVSLSSAVLQYSTPLNYSSM